MAEIYRSAFTQADLVKDATVTTIAGEFVKLGEYAVQAGELISLGYGPQSGQQNAQGRIYMDLQNSTAAVNGVVRLSVYSPQNRPLVILDEFRTETLRTNATDRTLQVPYPESPYWVSEDKKIVLEFLADESGTVDKSKSKILLDTTVQAL